MLKPRIALCLALVVGALTLINGILSSVRAVTILYRVVMSVVAFGLVGYAIGVVIEKFFKEFLEEKMSQPKHIDIVSEQQPLDEIPTESEFSQFTSDDFQQISRPKE